MKFRSMYHLVFPLFVIIFVFHSGALAHNRVVVVPLGGSYKHESPLVVPAADFRSDGSFPASTLFVFSFGYIAGTSQNFGCVVAPVYLPSGATVTKLSATIIDNDSSYNFNMSLKRGSHSVPLSIIRNMASLNSGSQSSQVYKVNNNYIDYAVIDNEKYTYYVATCLSSVNIRLYAVQIYFNE